MRRSTSAAQFEGTAGGLIRTMLAPDRIETCTPELVRRTAAAARDLGVPVRLHCCQSKIEYELVLQQHGMSPPEWMASLGLPVGTHAAAAWHVRLRAAVTSTRPGRDLEIIRDMAAARSCIARWCRAGTATS